MSRSLGLRRGWKHPTEFRPAIAKHSPQPVYLYRTRGSPRVGRAFRGAGGRWFAALWHDASATRRLPEFEVLPGWFKSRKTAVAAVQRAAEARKAAGR